MTTSSLPRIEQPPARGQEKAERWASAVYRTTSWQVNRHPPALNRQLHERPRCSQDSPGRRYAARAKSGSAHATLRAEPGLRSSPHLRSEARRPRRHLGLRLGLVCGLHGLQGERTPLSICRELALPCEPGAASWVLQIAYEPMRPAAAAWVPRVVLVQHVWATNTGPARLFRLLCPVSEAVGCMCDGRESRLLGVDRVLRDKTKKMTLISDSMLQGRVLPALSVPRSSTELPASCSCRRRGAQSTRVPQATSGRRVQRGSSPPEDGDPQPF